MYFVDDTTGFSYFDELTIIDCVHSEEFRKHENIVIVTVGTDFKTVHECRWHNSPRKLSEHFSTSFLCPFADGECGEEV
ncbi:TPA: hypothetical protein HA296_02605 [Candidatus Woesearchaeota archaeon]|nr:hypothetical protein [Candidatus Woesearchaeota archaeon]